MFNCINLLISLFLEPSFNLENLNFFLGKVVKCYHSQTWLISRAVKLACGSTGRVTGIMQQCLAFESCGGGASYKSSTVLLILHGEPSPLGGKTGHGWKAFVLLLMSSIFFQTKRDIFHLGPVPQPFRWWLPIATKLFLLGGALGSLILP